MIDQNLRGAVGLPVAVQLVGRPFEEEVVLRVMREIERAFGP
jgi:Asp-tRNA(Asn)/Glu-tRNA(Gln) amidotransferase A subunit family amidase